MALSEACKMILGGGPLGISSRNRGRIGIPSLAASDIAPRQRIALTVSSKVKQNNLSSKAKRQQRKARRSPSPLRDATINGEGGTKVQNSPDDHNASSQPDVSLNSINGSKDNTIMEAEVLENDFSHEGDVVGDEVPGVELLDGIAFRDLTAMIRNAEKNILLLNQARISALEDVEKILVEKEGLQKEVHRLETEIAVMGTVNKFSAKGMKELDKTGLVSEVLSLKEELHTLKRENISLKADLDTLQKKLSDEGGLLKKEGKDSDLSRASLEAECKDLKEKVENLQILLENTKNMNVFDKHEELQKENELLQHKVESLEEQLRVSDEEINAQIEQYQTSVMEFEETLNELKEESKKRSVRGAANDMPWSFWSGLLLTLDGWFLEKKITADDVKVLRNMAWKRDYQIRDAYLSCKDKSDLESISILLKLITPLKSSGLHIVHIAAEMAPVAKVGGLGDVVSGLSKALQKKGHLVEIILPKYDCMNHDIIKDLKELDTPVQSYFDGQLYENKIWVGVVEGLPVYFIEPQHPWKLFSRGQYYGEHDDFKRFSFFSRAALELLYQSGKKPDIIHCHDWQTAFVPPLYWDVYSVKGFNSARICFTCHNFEYQGTSHASELASCGLDVQQLHRPDRMQDNSSHDRINPVKGAIVYSNIVTTVSPTYAQEVRTAEGGRGLQETLNFHSRKFSGILNGIDTDAWNPATDSFLSHQYSSQDLHGKAENKDALRKRFNLSSDNSLQPLVGCITRLVPQKGVHLIRHAIYRTLELGGQFILLGSSPVPHIQREFEEIANHFRDHPHARLILSYDEALSRAIFAASDMFIIPSIFEPCGLTQMISMRYGSVPIVRKTGGLNDSVFDVDDQSVPAQLQNGFTFITPDEKGLSEAMERAFDLYTRNPKEWRDLVEKIMRIDFSWDSSSAQYEELYQSSLARARKSIKENAS